jgi:hypothetical protein
MTIVNGQVVFNRGEFNDQVRGKALTFQS